MKAWIAWWCWRFSQSDASLRVTSHHNAIWPRRLIFQKAPLHLHLRIHRRLSDSSQASWYWAARRPRSVTRHDTRSHPKWKSWSTQLQSDRLSFPIFPLFSSCKSRLSKTLSAGPSCAEGRISLSLATILSRPRGNFQTATYHGLWSLYSSHQTRKWVPPHFWKCAPSDSERTVPWTSLAHRNPTAGARGHREIGHAPLPHPLWR